MQTAAHQHDQHRTPEQHRKIVEKITKREASAEPDTPHDPTPDDGWVRVHTGYHSPDAFPTLAAVRKGYIVPAHVNRLEAAAFLLAVQDDLAAGPIHTYCWAGNFGGYDNDNEDGERDEWAPRPLKPSIAMHREYHASGDSLGKIDEGHSETYQPALVVQRPPPDERRFVDGSKEIGTDRTWAPIGAPTTLDEFTRKAGASHRHWRIVTQKWELHDSAGTSRWQVRQRVPQNWKGETITTTRLIKWRRIEASVIPTTAPVDTAADAIGDATARLAALRAAMPAENWNALEFACDGLTLDQIRARFGMGSRGEAAVSDRLGIAIRIGIETYRALTAANDNQSAPLAKTG